ncbi:hypothetical protein Aconfl_11800 [Algoriphagus confluentis]|uniref:Uncharacterized protein n=1 Tax=Algoriphagus confluentis TaxID=1697556 RepID=A0ABQ6PNZ6_9BACT|nr:hypothetical protein Aconfl_11800 [Algoriphagus confluentis]
MHLLFENQKNHEYLRINPHYSHAGINFGNHRILFLQSTQEARIGIKNPLSQSLSARVDRDFSFPKIREKSILFGKLKEASVLDFF